MTLNSREKLIAMAIGVVVALIVLFFAIVKPFWLDARDALQKNIVRDNNTLKAQQTMLDDQPKTHMALEVLRTQGMSSNPADELDAAEKLVRSFASTSNVSITEQRLTRATVVKDNKVETDFTEVQFVNQASGNSFGMAQLLLAIEKASFPMKIQDIQIRSRKPGTNDLSTSITISALVYTPKPLRAATHPGRGTHPSATATAPASLSVEEIEKQLQKRREQEMSAPPSTEPATTLPTAEAPMEGFTPMAGMAATEPATATAPAVSIEEATARMIAARRAEEARLAAAATAPATQPTTQPTGGVR